MSTVYLMYNGSTPFIDLVGDPAELLPYAIQPLALYYSENLAADLSASIANNISDPSFTLKPFLYAPNDTPPDSSCAPIFDVVAVDPSIGATLVLTVAGGATYTLPTQGFPQIVTAINNPYATSSPQPLGFLQDVDYTEGGKALQLALSITDVAVTFSLTMPTANLASFNAWGNQTVSTVVSGSNTIITGTLYQTAGSYTAEANLTYMYAVQANNPVSLYIPSIRDIDGTSFNYNDHNAMKYGIGWKSMILNSMIDNAAELTSSSGVYASVLGMDRTKPAFFRPWSEMNIITMASTPQLTSGNYTLGKNDLRTSYFQEFKFAQCGYHQYEILPGEHLSFDASLTNDPGDGRFLEVTSSRMITPYMYDLNGAPLQLPSGAQQVFRTKGYELLNSSSQPIHVIIPVIYAGAPDFDFEYSVDSIVVAQPLIIINYMVRYKIEVETAPGVFTPAWLSAFPSITFNLYPVNEQYLIPSVVNWTSSPMYASGIASELDWYQAAADVLNAGVDTILTNPHNQYPQAFIFSVINDENGISLQMMNKLPVAQTIGLGLYTYIPSDGNIGFRVTEILNPNATLAPQLNSTIAIGDSQSHCIKLGANPNVTQNELLVMASTGDRISMNDSGAGVQSATFNVKINGVLNVVVCAGDGTGSRGDGGVGWADNLLTNFFQSVPGIAVTGNFWNQITLRNMTSNPMTIELWTDELGWSIYLDDFGGQSYSTTADNHPNTEGFWVYLAPAHA